MQTKRLTFPFWFHVTGGATQNYHHPEQQSASKCLIWFVETVSNPISVSAQQRKFCQIVANWKRFENKVKRTFYEQQVQRYDTIAAFKLWQRHKRGTKHLFPLFVPETKPNQNKNAHAHQCKMNHWCFQHDEMRHFKINRNGMVQHCECMLKRMELKFIFSIYALMEEKEPPLNESNIFWLRCCQQQLSRLNRLE